MDLPNSKKISKSDLMMIADMREVKVKKKTPKKDIKEKCKKNIQCINI